MEKNNNLTNQKSINNTNNIPILLNPVNNLLNKYDIIQYNGLRIPRLSFCTNFIMNPYMPMFNTINVNFFNNPSSIPNNNELYNPLNRKVEQNLKEDNKCFNHAKIDNCNDKTKNEESKNLFNSVNKEEKNIYNNYINSQNFVKIKSNNEENKKIYFNNSNIQNIKGVNENKINIVNKNIYNILTFPNFNYYQPMHIIGNQRGNNEKQFENSNTFEPNLNSFCYSNDEILNEKTNLKENSIKEDNQELKKEDNKSENENKINFKSLKQKRGRKKIAKNKAKTHGPDDDDNILRKIQSHFITFCTCFVNDVIKTFIKSKRVPIFKNIAYKHKRIVSNKYFQNLKTKRIADILKLSPSPKLKNHDESENMNIYNKVCELCPFLKTFLEMKFIDFFKEYYFNKKKTYIVNGEIVQNSDRTKAFDDLISKNYPHKEKIKFIALHCFLEDEKAFEKLKFKTEH